MWDHWENTPQDIPGKLVQIVLRAVWIYSVGLEGDIYGDLIGQ